MKKQNIKKDAEAYRLLQAKELLENAGFVYDPDKKGYVMPRLVIKTERI